MDEVTIEEFAGRLRCLDLSVTLLGRQDCFATVRFWEKCAARWVMR